MKKLLFLFAIVLISCQKDGINSTKNELVGEWLWIKKTGGIAGVNESPQKGDTLILKIMPDNIYHYISNDSTIKSGTYTFSKKQSMLLQEEKNFIILDENGKYMYELSNDTLYLAEDYYDGFNYEYARIK